MAEPKPNTRKCKVCGEEKPLDGEHFREGVTKGGKPKWERTCKPCSREAARQRMQTKKQGDPEFTERQRDARERWKRNNPDRVEKHRKREWEAKGRTYRPPEERKRRRVLAFSSRQNRLAERNAKEAWRFWLNERAPYWWVARYYEALGRPWNNHRLSETDKYSLRYQRDAQFRQQERARLRRKKVERRWRQRVTGDGTIEQLGVKRRKSCPYCGNHLNADNAVLDHMDPLALGGEHSASNVIECCASCNSQKGSASFADWLTRLPERDAQRARREYQKLRGRPPEQQGFALAV